MPGTRFVNGLKQNVGALAGFIAAIWLVSIAGFVVSDVRLWLALVPRSPGHLSGILTMPFVHLDWLHIAANTGPLAVFAALIVIRGRRYFLLALLGSVLISGVLLWLFGRSAAHIGASGVVFAFFSLLVANAYFTRSIGNALIAIVVVTFYGGIVWGVLPSDSGVSWDGHLAGLVAGVLTARILRGFSPPILAGTESQSDTRAGS